jgi:hypothetical protein
MWEKLGIYDDTHNRAMGREEEVIEAHCRLGCFRMSICVLRTYRWRIEEARGGDRVAAEAEYVQGREVYSETDRGLAEVVGDRLWIERGAPGEVKSAEVLCGQW